MHRKNFISSLGYSVAAVCTGCLAGCVKSDSLTGGTPPTGINFNIDLTTQLLNIGDYLNTMGLIIVRLAATNAPASFTALQIACTHEGISVDYNKAMNEFVCPKHGAIFSTSGAVLQGPATVALRQYTITITNSTMNITG
jgi:cytochrome b6-f complex iron-sulfur subunit